jgi:NAD+ diphosphatase
LLGRHADVTYFICLHSGEKPVDSSGSWLSLRQLGEDVDDAAAALLATGTALTNWHLSHLHCVRCGSPTISQEAGWSRRCEPCSYTHFPRTDPAVIVLVRDEQDRALLARQRRWEPGWFSTLAGFVEAGESAEAAVVREVREEAGVVLDDARIQYLGSQPWPFPGSLMLGYHAWALTTQVEPDGEEIAEARWFTRDELRVACDKGEVLLPPRISIARALIEEWFGETLSGDWIRA